MKRTLVVGVDGSTESRAVADWAAREALRRDRRLRVIHAWLWQPLEAPIVHHRDSEASRAQDIVREVEAELTHRVRESLVGARVGSVAHAVLHHAVCPVAVVPHP